MIIIDGDACPDIDIITKLCKELNESLSIYIDITHNIENDYANIFYMDKHSQSVDVAIINNVNKNDLVITNDYGLATMCLAVTNNIINTKGSHYNKNNIDLLLDIRHVNSKLRKSGIRTKGPKKRTTSDTNKLISSIKEFILNK